MFKRASQTPSAKLVLGEKGQKPSDQFVRIPDFPDTVWGIHRDEARDQEVNA